MKQMVYLNLRGQVVRQLGLGVVSAPSDTGGLPGYRADGPGNLVNLCTQEGLGFSSLEAATLRAVPVPKKGGLYGLNSETQQPAFRYKVTRREAKLAIAASVTLTCLHTSAATRPGELSLTALT